MPSSVMVVLNCSILLKKIVLTLDFFICTSTPELVSIARVGGYIEMRNGEIEHMDIGRMSKLDISWYRLLLLRDCS